MTPNILKVMGWFKESSEFMWFDLGSMTNERDKEITEVLNDTYAPVMLHTQTLPKDIPMPFEQLGIVINFIDKKGRPILTAVTFDRVGNDMQVTFRHPSFKGVRELIFTQVGARSEQGVHDLNYGGEAFAVLTKMAPFKDAADPEAEIVTIYTDLARTVYAALYLDLVNKKIKTTVYQPLPNPANAKRMAKGKKPLFEWRVIDVTANHVLPEDSQPTGRTHASPRRHMRRGHMRTYKSGKKAWVKQTMVGKIEFGYIHHSYTAQGDQHATT